MVFDHPDTQHRLAARLLLREAVVWDNIFPLEPPFGNDFDKLPVLAGAGWTMVSLTVGGDRDTGIDALRIVAAARRRITRDDRLVFMRKAEDVRRAKREGRLAVGLHFQGTRCFERNLDLVEAFFDLGVRHALIAFNNANDAGGGCAEPDGGLTRFGRRLMAEMERCGMLVDVSHTGRRTALQVFEAASAPVLISHSNADAIHPHWRNVTDEMIRACAATGGIIGLSGSSGYLGDPAASTEAMFRHLDHMVGLVGPAHVGLGLDLVFDCAALNAWLRTRPDEWPEAGDPAWPGFRYCALEQLEELTATMLSHGWSSDDARLVLGGSYLALAERMWGV